MLEYNDSSDPLEGSTMLATSSLQDRLNEEEKNDIVASMMGVPLTAEDMINTACATKALIDEAFQNKNSPSSVSA